MGKSVYIAEKPSVAQEFAKALGIKAPRGNGFIESSDSIITWCVGHLVTMSYPDAYNMDLKKWKVETLPFLPEIWKYEIIPSVKKQFEIVKSILTRNDIDTIYVCTDAGREGEYIYRLVDMMCNIKCKNKKRVWIDSQTEDEILRGIREAKPLNEYDNLSESAYLRAKEDYLMGINFSRILTLKYGSAISKVTGTNYTVISVGRVMTCVLGMIVRREREIRSFVKMPFYKILADIQIGEGNFEAEWKAVKGSKYFGTPVLYKDNGFKEKNVALGLIEELSNPEPITAVITSIERKKENKNPPLLYNLAELQNDCSKMFKISPDETLKITQELYEKKLVTYPRTDARVLSTVVAKEIYKNIHGLKAVQSVSSFVDEILDNNTYKNIVKSKYVNDKQVTDHYAIIPTGQGISSLKSVSQLTAKVYSVIVRRFLSIFYPPAIYQKINIISQIKEESFVASFKVLIDVGYLKVLDRNPTKKKDENGAETEENEKCDQDFIEKLKNVKKGKSYPVNSLNLKAGETSPPKRYNSGSMILAMENAGQLIEDEDLRAQIKGSGIGTSATRAEILKKLITISYLSLNKKTQVVTPTYLGEMIFDVVESSIKSLLNPELTASWEKGLTYVTDGELTSDEYMNKLEAFVRQKTEYVKNIYNQNSLQDKFYQAKENYIK